MRPINYNSNEAEYSIINIKTVYFKGKPESIFYRRIRQENRDLLKDKAFSLQIYPEGLYLITWEIIKKLLDVRIDQNYIKSQMSTENCRINFYFT